jgi:hypothetical protein
VRKDSLPLFSFSSPLSPLTTKSSNHAVHVWPDDSARVILRFGISIDVGSLVAMRCSPISSSATFCLTVSESIFVTFVQSSPSILSLKLDGSQAFALAAETLVAAPEPALARRISGSSLTVRTPGSFEAASAAGMLTSVTSARKNCRSETAFCRESAATIDPSRRTDFPANVSASHW